MAAPAEFRGAVAAVDWSGAKARRAQAEGIAVALVRDGSSVDCSAGRTRDEAIDYLIERAGPMLVGLDFSFGFPAWFAHEHACASITDVWALAEQEGETWLWPRPPFWRRRCEVPTERRFRRCEDRLRADGFAAKSIFQLVGNGQVGAGSVRGMPLLARLRASGFAIWPFDDASERTVFEIYPTRLRALAPAHVRATKWASPHERDAATSAWVMWEHRDAFATRKAASEPVTLIEGDLFVPPS